MLYQRMRNEPPEQPHTEWAMQDPPPKGTWIAYVRSMQKSHMIQDLVLPEHVQQSTRISQRKGQFRKYAKQVVRPRVGKAAMAQKEGGLPWVWMAKNLTTKEHVRCFEQWWVWRIQGRPPWDKQEKCPLCGRQTVPKTEHIQRECPEAARMAQGTSLTTMDFLDTPTTPEGFKAQMSLAEQYNRMWVQTCDPERSVPGGDSQVGDMDEPKNRVPW